MLVETVDFKSFLVHPNQYLMSYAVSYIIDVFLSSPFIPKLLISVAMYIHWSSLLVVNYLRYNLRIVQLWQYIPGEVFRESGNNRPVGVPIDFEKV